MTQIIELKPSIAGSHISSACQAAIEQADHQNSKVAFTFNDTRVIVSPGEKAQDVEARWVRDFEAAAEAYRQSPEHKAAQEKSERDRIERETRTLHETASTEQEMRAAKAPWPYTEKQLIEYIDSLVNRQHDYGTGVYAVSLAASATFNYVAHKLGASGFQSSCADLDFLRRTRDLKGPFMLINAEDALYPQYDLREKLEEALTEWKPWLKTEASKKLAESPVAHPEVIAHWRKLSEEPR